MSWKKARLKHLCVDSGQYGLNIPAQDYSTSGHRLLRTSDIDEFGRLRSGDGAVYIDAPLENRHQLLEGDLLLSRSGTIGRSLLLDTLNEPSTYAGYLVRFRPTKDTEPRFLAYVSASRDFQSAIESDAVTSTIQNFNAERYANIPVMFPSLDEQRRISDFLDAETAQIDRIHILRSQQREHLLQRRWPHFQQAIDQVPLDYVPLRRLIHSLIDGPFGSAFSSSDYVDEGAAVIRLGNIGFCEYRREDQARIPMELYRTFQNHSVRKGDILIAGLGDPTNHAGRACIAPDLGPAIVKGKCFRARVDEDRTSASFIAMLLSSPIGASILEGRGSTRSMINLEIVKSAALPIPRQADQIAIAAETARDWQIALRTVHACDRQIALLAERRQALITAAVTGQFDVTTAQGLSKVGIS